MRRALIPLSTLCILQAICPVGNSVYAAEKEWPFIPVKELSLPQVKNGNWGRNGIDPFILSRLETKGLGPAQFTGLVHVDGRWRCKGRGYCRRNR